MSAHNYETDILCPYCDKANEPPDDMPANYSTELECEHCAKFFRCEPYVTVEYSTHGDCAKNKQLPHKLKPVMKFHDESTQYKCTQCYQQFYDWALPGGKYPRLREGEFEIVCRAVPEII